VFLFSSLIREIKENLSNFLIRLIQGGIGTELLNPERLTKIVEEFIGKGDLEIHEKDEYLKKVIYRLNVNQDKLFELLKDQKEIEWRTLIQVKKN